MRAVLVLGNYGEFVGAIAVVTTLAYLAVQIPQSSQAERRTTRDSRIMDFVEIRKAPHQNPALKALR